MFLCVYEIRIDALTQISFADHSVRLEHKLQTRLNCVALVRSGYAMWLLP